MPSMSPMETLLVSLCVLGLSSGVLAGVCPGSMGYPASCPRPDDPPTYTQCCRYNYNASCCEERATVICATNRFGDNFQRQRNNG